MDTEIRKELRTLFIGDKNTMTTENQEPVNPLEEQMRLNAERERRRKEKIAKKNRDLIKENRGNK